nr:MAG TPA: hypothetical protein [Caudoviricetes sp.]
MNKISVLCNLSLNRDDFTVAGITTRKLNSIKI